MSALGLTITNDASILFDAVSDGSILEITYLRSNLCGHETGSIDVKI